MKPVAFYKAAPHILLNCFLPSTRKPLEPSPDSNIFEIASSSFLGISDWNTSLCLAKVQVIIVRHIPYYNHSVENSAECVSSHSKKHFIIGYKYFRTQIYSFVIPTFGGIIKGKVKLVRHQRLFVLRQEEKSWM